MLGISLGAAGLMGEGLLRWVFHSAPLLDLDIYYLDAGRHLRMRPGIERRHVTRLWDVRIAVNQEGFRDRATPITSPAPPILALGDSFAFGWGVNLEDTYLFRLEERLNQSRPIRVVKAGMNGTGTGDQFQFLESIGPQYQPQMVLLSLFVGNDFTDVQMGGMEQFEVQDGLLIRRQLRPLSWFEASRQKLVRTSHLLQFLRAAQLDLARRWAAGRAGGGAHAGLTARDPWLLEFSKVHLRKLPEETAGGVEQTLTYLDRFLEYCRLRDADFVLLVIPRSMQIYPAELAEWQAAFQISNEDLDLDHPQRILREWADRRGARMLDLLPEFRRHRAERPEEKLYYYPDAHFNAAGHKLTAEVLAAYLEKEGLPRLPSPP